jgi:hypothetical protein
VDKVQDLLAAPSLEFRTALGTRHDPPRPSFVGNLLHRLETRDVWRSLSGLEYLQRILRQRAQVDFALDAMTKHRLIDAEFEQRSPYRAQAPIGTFTV